MEIHVDQSEEILWLRIVGRLDRSASPRLAQQLEQLVGAHQGNLVIDLTGVSVFSAACAEVLYNRLVHLRKEARSMTLCAPPPRIAGILQLSGLTRVLRVVDDAAQLAGAVET